MIHDTSCCLLLLTYRIRKAGFSIRYTFEEFVNRYRVVMTDLRIPDSELREMSEELAKSLFRDVEWTIGNRMIFLKVSLINSPRPVTFLFCLLFVFNQLGFGWFPRAKIIFRDCFLKASLFYIIS